MEIIDTHYDMQAPADAVWPLLEDFADIQTWWPKGKVVDIERVEVEGNGVGCIRHIYNVGFPNAISERLDFLDPENRMLKLSIVCDLPAGMVQYQATGQLIELDANSCRMTYHGEFLAEEGKADEVRGFLLGAYDLMFQGLEAAAQRSLA
jgi:hypothetical protein